MGKTLFTIDDSEKQRILEMHQSATKKQYLGEQGVATTPTTTPTPAKTITPSIAPIAITEFRLANEPVRLFKNNVPVALNVYVKPISKDGKTVPGVYNVEVSNIKEIPNLRYIFSYNCGSPDTITYTNSVIPKENDLAGVTATFRDRTFKNVKKTSTIGFEQKEYNELINLLTQAKGMKWDMSNFSNLPKCS